MISSLLKHVSNDSHVGLDNHELCNRVCACNEAESEQALRQSDDQFVNRDSTQC